MKHRFSGRAAGAVLCAIVTAAVAQPAADGPAAALRMGDFAAAGRGFEAALKAAPGDAAALAGLARVRLFENKTEEAIALAREAIAIVPDPVAQQTIRVAEQRKAAMSSGRYQISAANGEAVIPFVVTDPLPVVEVTIAGRKAQFLIDTGAPDIMIGPDLVKELGLSTEAAGEGVFAGGVRAQVERTVVPEFQIGALKVSNMPGGVMRQQLGIPGVKIEGIVGTGLLMHFLSTLDYCKGQLVLRPRDASAAFEAGAARAGANIVPIWLASDHFILARAQLERGREHLFLIDTGLAGGGISATKATLDEAGVTPNEAAATTGIGGGGPVTVIPFRSGAKLGSLAVADVQGFYTPGGNTFAAFPFDLAGLLSHAMFRRTRLTFDFDAMRLITEAC